MKQRVSDRLLRKAEAITGRQYLAGYANGSRPHGIIECWFGPADERGALHNADWVNLRTCKWMEYARMSEETALRIQTQKATESVTLRDRIPQARFDEIAKRKAAETRDHIQSLLDNFKQDV